MVKDHCSCCDPQFKKHIIHIHKRCKKVKTHRYIVGSKLNAYFNINLDNSIKYKVCCFISDKLKNYNATR